MSPPPAQVVCLLWLLSVVSAAAQPGIATGDLEVPVEPGRPMTLLFDAALDQQTARSESHDLGLQRVAVGEDTLTFQVPAELQQGTRLHLTLRFADRQPPERMSLVLVVDAAHAQASVTVSRRSVGCEESLAAKDAELAAIKEELRDRAGSLTEFIATGVLGEKGVRVVPINVGSLRSLTVLAARIYVARERMAVEVLLKAKNKKNMKPWAPRTAQLTLRASPVAVRRMLLVEGPLRKWKDTARLIVEWDAPGAHPEEPPPPYALEVSQQDGSDTLRAPCLSSAQCGAEAAPGKK